MLLCVARDWVVGAQASFVVVLLFVCLSRKRRASSLPRERTKRHSATATRDRFARSSTRVCPVGFFVGLNRFAILTVGDRQSRHWRRGARVCPPKGAVFFVFFALRAAGCCARGSVLCAARRCVHGSTLCALGAMCARLCVRLAICVCDFFFVCALLDAVCATR